MTTAPTDIIVQMKLSSGEEVVAVRNIFNKTLFKDVMLIERNTFTVTDEYTGEVSGTQVFYMMRSWMLHQFDRVKDDPEEMDWMWINPSNVIAAFTPRRETVEQYLNSVKQLKKTGEFGETDETFDSDWDSSLDSDSVDLTLLEKLKSSSRLN